MGLKALLTSFERKRPWSIYLTPGLLASEILHASILIIGLRSLRRHLFKGAPNVLIDLPTTASLIIYVAVALASTLLITPLQVIATRLSVQRNHPASKATTAMDRIGLPEYSAEETPTYAGNGEDVIE